MTGATFTGGAAGGLSLPSAGSGSGFDLSKLLGGGGAANDGYNLGNLLGGVASATSGSSGVGSFFSGAASGALAGSTFGPVGTFVGGAAGGLLSLFSPGQKTDVAAQDGAVAKVAATNGLSVADAGRVIAYQADNSGDHYNDLAIYLAGGVGDGGGPAYFLRLVDKYNAANPGQAVHPGSLVAAAKAQAAQQQELLHQATTSFSFASSAQGQNLIATLQQLPASQAVGTEGLTAGDYLKQILDGVLKGAQAGGATAAANTPAGQQIKRDTINDYLKEYQLAVAGGVLFLGFTIYKAYIEQ